MLEAFELGGFGMIPTFVFGLIALGSAALYAMRPTARYVPLLVSSSILTLVAGAFGFVTGVIATFSSILVASDRGMALVGVGEAAHCLALALGIVLVALMGATLGTLRVARAPVMD